MPIPGKYQAVPGFFAQDDPHAIPLHIGALPPRFGLIDDSPDRWDRLLARLGELNDGAEVGTVYRLLFLSRHGEGTHNVAEATYGSERWNDYWSKLDRDGALVWGPDPELTTKGILQAKDAREAWEAELAAGVPLPHRSYSSPLTRAIRTCDITLKGLCKDQEWRPLILEKLREDIGEHTCDKRRTLSYIRSEFPQFEVEPGFTEEDELWTTEREAEEQRDGRAQWVMDQIFWEGMIISVHAHGGIINSLLTVIGRSHYALPTGGVLPVIVKGVRT